MVIYRPHRGSLDEAMTEYKEFDSMDDLKKYVANEHTPYVDVDDIVIGDSDGPDHRIGWGDVHMIGTKRYGDEDYIAKYKVPQCIGYCATIYKSPLRVE